MKVLIAINNSPGSTGAIHSVAQRPWPARTVFRILTCVEDAVSPMPDIAFEAAIDVSEEHKTLALQAEALITQAAQLLTRSGLHVESAVRHGSPGGTIVEEADEWNADWIVLGANDDGSRFTQWLLGSVVQSVVKHASCSVEVIRQKAREKVSDLEALVEAEDEEKRVLASNGMQPELV